MGDFHLCCTDCFPLCGHGGKLARTVTATLLFEQAEYEAETTGNGRKQPSADPDGSVRPAGSS
ncbi:hypothetical protein GCM10009579_05400 [Streptomyces javensis]|uniref:Uncharacterized protein n=1 Tax=Streptomyces javensis TaxID=114698 RepID=A0ABN1WLD3_9ACTN